MSPERSPQIDLPLIITLTPQGVEWFVRNRRRTECFLRQDFEAMAEFVSFHTPDSDEHDSGNALFAAVEYWDRGVVFNRARNAVAVAKSFPQRRHGIELA